MIRNVIFTKTFPKFKNEIVFVHDKKWPNWVIPKTNLTHILHKKRPDFVFNLGIYKVGSQECKK